MTTPDPTRSKAIEVMARALAAEIAKPAHENLDEVPSRGEAMAACLALSRAALTAYESHLQAEGMAVVPGWQPIGIAPRDGTRVLGFFPDLQDGYYDTEWTRHGVWASRAYPNQPTHFKPLPDPPASPSMKAGKEESK